MLEVAEICPRCGGGNISINYGLSRLDNATRICSPCEQDEAMEDWFSGELTPMNVWPVNKPWSEEND